MGVGKTERASLYDSRFTVGKRSDAANDRIIRNLKVKGGKIRKIGDKWTIEPAIKTYREIDEGGGGGGGGSGGGGSCPDITIVLEEPTTAGDTVSVVTGIEPDGHELTLKRQTITISPDPGSGSGSGSGSGLPSGTADHMILRWDAATSTWEQIGGYDERDVVLYARDGILTGTILFKPAESGSYVSYDSDDHRKLLQVVDSGSSQDPQLLLDYGHLADGGT